VAYFATYAATTSFDSSPGPPPRMARTSISDPHPIEVSALPSAASSGQSITAEALAARTAASSCSIVNSAGGAATALGSPSGGAASMRTMAWKWIAPRRWYSPTFTIRSFTCRPTSAWLMPITVASSRGRYVRNRPQSFGAMAFHTTWPW